MKLGAEVADGVRNVLEELRELGRRNRREGETDQAGEHDRTRGVLLDELTTNLLGIDADRLHAHEVTRVERRPSSQRRAASLV